MRIAIGTDHHGVEIKAYLKERLASLGHTVIDKGPATNEPVDYPDFAVEVARAVGAGEVERGILVCGTGVGMSMAANKVPGVRAAVVTDAVTSEMSRRHNDANVFCAGARILTPERAAELVRLWLDTPFEGGRHARRVEKINQLDAGRA